MKKLDHVPALDGLRGLACIIVIFAHLELAPRLMAFSDVILSNRILQIFYQLVEFGWVGLDIFFVLSGFFITRILISMRYLPLKSYLTNYFFRRGLRIFPLYYGFMLIYFFLLPVQNFPHNSYQIYWDHKYFFFGLLPNFVWNNGAFHPGELMHFWSLGIEAQFYLAWPLIIYFLGVRGVVISAILCLLIAIFSRVLMLDFFALDGQTIYVSTQSRLDGLALGSLIAAFDCSRGNVKALRKTALVLGALGLIAFIGVLVHDNHFAKSEHFNQTISAYTPAMLYFGYTGVSLATAGFIILALNSARGDSKSKYLSNVFSNRMLLLFAKHSYAIYITHVYVIGLGCGIGMDLLFFRRWIPVPVLSDAIYFAIYTALSLLLGWIIYHVYEKHFYKLKKYQPSMHQSNH